MRSSERGLEMRKITRTGIVILVVVSMLGLLGVWKVALTAERGVRERGEPEAKKEKKELNILSSKKEEEKKKKEEDRKREEEEQEDPVIDITTHKKVGRFIGFSPRKSPKYVGIGVDKENKDYYFTLPKDLENMGVVNRKTLEDFVRGDNVEITYEKITSMTEDGREKAENKAISIKFLSPEIKGVLKSGK